MQDKPIFFFYLVYDDQSSTIYCFFNMFILFILSIMTFDPLMTLRRFGGEPNGLFHKRMSQQWQRLDFLYKIDWL